MSLLANLANYQQIFDAIKSEISTTFQDEEIFKSFIMPLTLVKVDGNNLTISCGSEFKRQVISEHYLDLLKSKWTEKLNQKVVIELISEGQVNKAVTNVRIGLQEDYSFNNLVVGEFNKSAFMALNSLLSSKKWNPVFITGGVGLGKTHLLHALGNAFSKQFPSQSVCYVSSNDFISQLYDSFQDKKHGVDSLLNRYLSYDLLLIDDVQFFAKKDKVCEIFFNIFNRNINRQKLIVMTSDKTPSELDNIDNRLKSRFASGLVINISRPDLESVKTIFEQKIKDSGENFAFNKEAINFITKRYQNDIRKLEGCLHRIIFYSINNLAPNAIISVDIIKKALQEDFKNDKKQFGFDVDPDFVIQQICDNYQINIASVKSKTQTKQITFVRHLCMYVLREKFNMSFEQIGSYFHRGHSTVIDGVSNIEKLVKTNDQLKEFIQTLYQNL